MGARDGWEGEAHHQQHQQHQQHYLDQHVCGYQHVDGITIIMIIILP